MAELRRCIHGRTERQKCRKCRDMGASPRLAALEAVAEAARALDAELDDKCGWRGLGLVEPRQAVAAALKRLEECK